MADAALQAPPGAIGGDAPVARRRPRRSRRRGHARGPGDRAQRTPLELDERASKKLNKLLAKTLEQALAIAGESAERGGEVFPTELGILHFRRAP